MHGVWVLLMSQGWEVLVQEAQYRCICGILLLRYHGWIGGWEGCVCCGLVYWILLVPFDKYIDSSC